MIAINPNNIDTIRRVALGLGLGLIAVLFLSMLGGDNTSYNDTIDFDQETITLPGATAAREDDAEITPLSASDERAARYKFFAQNKVSLSAEKATALSEGKPALSVIINNVGQQRAFTEKLMSVMPQDVTIGLSPFISNDNQNAISLRDYGYEIWMNMAAITLEENNDTSDFALTPTNNFEFNINLLSDQIGDKNYLTGLILPPQAIIKRSGKLWEDLVYDIFGQGYGLLDNSSGIIKPSLYFYDDERAPYIESDFVMSDTMSIEDFKAALNTVRQNTLSEGGYILSLSEATPVHLDILAEWLNSLPNEGITLVPLSAQAKL
jgi:polysaccharide deacetylase 2 family uncharacterized protein YibQ